MEIPQAVIDQIDKTISALNNKKFDPDPIAGEHFSKITSVMSSAYKRHGFIIERAILESVNANPRFEAWEDKAFAVSTAADSIANDFMSEPSKAISSQVPYEDPGPRSLQIDLAAYEADTKTLTLYEVKRGSGLHDAGKRRQILRDLLCMELQAKSYGESKGFEVDRSRAHIIFYYGKCSIKEPFALTSDDLNTHFGFQIKEEIEAANALFKKRLFEILTGQ
jgi:hypothetical protein